MRLFNKILTGNLLLPRIPFFLTATRHRIFLSSLLRHLMHGVSQLFVILQPVFEWRINGTGMEFLKDEGALGAKGRALKDG